MEDFSSTGQLVTLGFVDSSIGAMAKGLALVDVEALVVKDMLLSLKHSMGHSVVAIKLVKNLACLLNMSRYCLCTHHHHMTLNHHDYYFVVNE